MIKYKIFLVFFILNLNWLFIHAEAKYPVDISYLVTDFKYSKEHGIKICEVQHGSISVLRGDIAISGGDGIISPKIADFFSFFPAKKWAMGLTFPSLTRCLEEKGWVIEKSINSILNNPQFLECSAILPSDPFSLASYSGLVYADDYTSLNYDYYNKTYPGIVFMNAASLPYWKDKYKMNVLFNLCDELKPFKADWRLYKKKYDPQLAARIQEDMPSDLYVIKPRKEKKSNGVIVVAHNDLDSVLNMLLNPDVSLKRHPDNKYSFWWYNKEDTFLVEKYYQSDYVCEADYHYDTTLRIAFILKYDGNKMTYHCQGGFKKLPLKALEEEGTLNEKRISCGKNRFYRAIEPDLLNEINVHMEKAMLLLYEQMLNVQSQ